MCSRLQTRLFVLILWRQFWINIDTWNLTKLLRRGHNSEYRTLAALYVESCYCFGKRWIFSYHISIWWNYEAYQMSFWTHISNIHTSSKEACEKWMCVLSFSTKCVSAKKSCSANSTEEKLQCLFHLVDVDIDLVQFPFYIKNYFSAKSFINISQSIILSAKYRVQNP